MRRTTLSVLSALAILLSGMIVPEAAAQSRRDKEQTYVLEKPYEVKKLVPPTGKKIKNVILMIGDGMSLMHMYSAWTANRGKLWLDNSQYTGLSKTYCANRLITDSGAGGTALATGHKTNYHMVGVDPEGKPLESLATLANKKGLSSGIAVTCRLWDATPADFCCHNTDRDAEAEIVADYVNCGVDYVFGGGSGTEYLAVTPWGDLYPCHQFVGQEEFLMGNVDTGVTRTDIRDEFKLCNVYAKEKCRKCFARFYCSGGCAANSYNFHGCITDAYDIGCEMQKKRIECAIMIKAALAEEE